MSRSGQETGRFIGEYDAAEIMTMLDGTDEGEAFTDDDAMAFIDEYGMSVAEDVHEIVWAALTRFLEERTAP